MTTFGRNGWSWKTASLVVLLTAFTGSARVMGAPELTTQPASAPATRSASSPGDVARAYTDALRDGEIEKALNFYAFDVLLRDAFGDDFHRCSAAERSDMADRLRRLLHNGLAELVRLDAFQDAEFRGFAERQQPNDRIAVEYEVEMWGRTAGNTLVFARGGQEWRIVDLQKTVAGGQPQSMVGQLRSVYQTVRKTKTPHQFVVEMTPTKKQAGVTGPSRPT